MRRKAWRYLLIKLIAGGTPTKEEFYSALIDSIKRFFGELGLAEINPRIIAYNDARREAILRCSREATEKLRASVPLITEIKGKSVIAFVAKTSGSIKGLKCRK
jgi:RNase P/RNase MRP subunit POP5